MNPSFTQSLESQTLSKLLAKAEYGAIITYEDMNASIKGDTQGQSRSALATARRSLLKSGFVFDSVRNVGLKRLHPAEISLTTPRLIRRVGRAARKHAVELGTADISTLSSDEQKRHSASMLHTALIASTADRSITHRVEEVSPSTNGPLDLDAVRRIYGAQ